MDQNYKKKPGDDRRMVFERAPERAQFCPGIPAKSDFRRSAMGQGLKKRIRIGQKSQRPRWTVLSRARSGGP